MQKNITRSINLYPINNKFNTNLGLIDIPNYKINYIPYNYSIHKYVFSDNISSDSCFIFNSSFLNQEILEFIQSASFNFFILLDSHISPSLSFYNKVTFIYDDLHLKKDFENSIILPQYLVNKKLYRNNGEIFDKINQIIYFCDSETENIDTNLEKLLYPNSHLPIKLFNNSKFKHAQNIGSINEIEKIDILRESKYYLHNNSNYYVAEALVSDCICINIDKDMSITEQLSMNNNSDIEYQKIKNEILDYSDFVLEILNDK